MSTTLIPNRLALGNAFTTLPTPPHEPLPPPKPIAHHGLLIRAINAGKPEVTVGGVRVRNPEIQEVSTLDPTAPGEFVVKGTIDLFGDRNIVAEFAIWHGPPPSGVVTGPATPSVQRAFIKDPIKLAKLVPHLGGTPLAVDITLHDVYIYHQNYLYDPTKEIGYDFDAQLAIDGSPGSLSAILTKVLGVKETDVSLHASFGPDQSWNDTPKLNTLTLEGSIAGHTYAPSPGVQIASVGVRFILTRNENKAITCVIEVFGRLKLTLPAGGVLPLELDYTLRDDHGKVTLDANLPFGVAWASPLGVKGFVLNPVKFNSSLLLSDPWKALTLNITAELRYQTFPVTFIGSYVPGGACSLRVHLDTFDLASLQQLYGVIHHEPLKAPTVDVTIGSADLILNSVDGLSATLTNVNIAGYGSANAVLHFSSAGCVISANLDTVPFGDVVVKSARIELNLYPASSDKASSAFIYGDVKFEGLDPQVAVHLYSSAPDVVPKRTEWTVFAELSASDNKLALSKIEPKLQGTKFDLALRNVVFIAASQNDPDAGTFIPGAYKPKEGVQVFAVFDEIPVLNSLTKSNVAGAVLHASWSRTLGFKLDVILPVARNLNLGRGITTTPITLSLALVPNSMDTSKLTPSLMVSAGLNIPVSRSPNPLLFEMKLTATDTNASIEGSLDDYWINPFGISNELSVGPKLALQVDVSYVTGIAGVMFTGGFAIGNTTGDAKVSVDENPEKEMLFVKVDNLNFADVVAFTEKLLHLHLPPPPRDFLDFKTIKSYICPVGMVLDDVVYPPGFSFKCDMVLFGKNCSVSCATKDKLLSIDGFIQEFDMGPVKVMGMDDKSDAVVQIKVGDNIQHLVVDGAVSLYGDKCGMRLSLDTQPPQISFKTKFNLTHLLAFEMDARLVGAPNLKDLRNAIFVFDADLEQHLLDYIHDELLSIITKAKQAADEGIDAAKKKVADEKAALDKEISDAQTHLDDAMKSWTVHDANVRTANNAFIKAYDDAIRSLESAIKDANTKWNLAKEGPNRNLLNAQHDRQVKVQAARDDLNRVNQKADAEIEAAKRKIAAADADLRRDFGSAENNIEIAKRHVEELQGRIDGVQHEIESLEHASWWKQFKIGELEAEKLGLKTELELGLGALDAAEAVLKLSDYVTENAVLKAAQGALDLAQRTKTALVSDAQRALDTVDHLTQAVIDRAFEAVQAVENGAEKVVLNGALLALAAYKRINDAVFDAANKAILDLIHSAEYLAYQSATTALAAAHGATRSLNAAEDVLTEIEHGYGEMLDLAKKIIDEAAGAFDVTSVVLSGSLSKSASGDHLLAVVKVMVEKKEHVLRLELNPSNVEAFFKDVLRQLIASLKKI